nr:PREDICTED: uncharacterized protein LOC109036940 [Bemisia tabaci]XP_018906913.1 PREDICTED: uncharacterized protein LOC109036940 [Bemisia tabaci]
MNTKQRKRNPLRDTRLPRGGSGVGLAKISGTGLNKRSSGNVTSIGRNTSGARLRKTGASVREPELNVLTYISEDDFQETDSNISTPAVQVSDDGDLINVTEELRSPNIVHVGDDTDEHLAPEMDEGSTMQPEEPVAKRVRKFDDAQPAGRRSEMSTDTPSKRGEILFNLRSQEADFRREEARERFEAASSNRLEAEHKMEEADLRREEAVVRLAIAEEELRCTKLKTKIVIANKRAMRDIMENQVALSQRQSVLP